MKHLYLVYMKNYETHMLPVRDIDHAIRLADALADSDLIDDSVECNSFDVCIENLDNMWMSDDGEFFEDYWRSLRGDQDSESKI